MAFLDGGAHPGRHKALVALSRGRLGAAISHNGHR